jgi:late embryogenesis abundant protein
MHRKTSFYLLASILAAMMLVAGCASISELTRVVQPPRFASAPDRKPELHIAGPSSSHRTGSASIRLWALVENPNPFGVVLDRLNGTFFLDQARAADVDFPLGLDLGARDDTVVPLDITVDFDDLGGIANVLRRAASSRELGYRVEGTVGVDAGPLGGLTYGPTDLLEGTLDASAVRSALP